MAQLGQLGDLTGASVSNGYEPVPAGSYRAQVIDTEISPTKDGTGQLLKATFEIQEGAHAGKKIITRYNLRNKNPQAQEIGLGQLKALATYSGHPNPNMIRDTNELHGRPVLITVAVKAGNDQYGPSNEIKSYAPIGNQAPKPAAAGFAAPPKPQAAAAAAADDIPAWETAPSAPADLKAAAGF